MDKYSEAVSKIVIEQELVMGPLALLLANKIKGIAIENKDNVSITGDPKVALGSLVSQYGMLFGKISIEVSKNALKHVSTTLSPQELPDILK
jgi:hypothetical protein